MHAALQSQGTNEALTLLQAAKAAGRRVILVSMGTSLSHFEVDFGAGSCAQVADEQVEVLRSQETVSLAVSHFGRSKSALAAAAVLC